MTSAPALSRAAVDEAVSAERRRLADSVADLTDEQWAAPSLCDAWTVRDVVALAAARAAAYSTAELVAQLRESADSTRRFPGSTPMDPLMDLVVHGQDIARPLRRRHVSPPEVVATCLAYVATNRFMGGPRRLSGVRLVSADTGWTLGDGAELRGADSDLLLVAAGRRAGLTALDGPGAAVVAERLR